jgi:hypothetical protein
MSDTDLSHVYANSDLDETQDNHSDLPDELRLHMAMAFAHKAGLAAHPGKYAGPPVKVPADWQDKQDSFGQKEVAQSESIANLASGDSAVIPSSAPAPKTESPSGAPKAKAGQPVSEAFKNWSTDPSDQNASDSGS